MSENAITTMDAIFNPSIQQSALKFCKSALDTGLLSASIQSPQQALIILLTGQELGMGPMESLRGIHVVKGKAELSAVAMSSRLLKGGVAIQTLTLDHETCRLQFTRTIGGHKTQIQTSFTKQDAERAQLWGKGNWVKYPQDMLYARALTRGARRIAADLIAGAYVKGEISDAVEVEREEKREANAETNAKGVEAVKARLMGGEEPEPEAEPEAKGPEVVDTKAVEVPAQNEQSEFDQDYLDGPDF
jgi:hypothetical protein